MCRTLMAFVLGATAAGPVTAQGVDPKPPQACFRGRPLPQCHSFWITEAGYAVRLAPVDHQTAYAPGGWLLPSLELGGMKNVSQRVAVGASLGAGVLGNAYLAVKPRIRYWLSPTSALDLSPGVMLNSPMGMPRVTADASIMFRDQLGFTVQSFIVPVTTYHEGSPPTTRNRLTLYLGLRLGSKLGVGGAAADAVTLLAAVGTYILACSNGGCD